MEPKPKSMNTTVRTAHIVHITVHNCCTQHTTNSSGNLPRYLQTNIMLSLGVEGAQVTKKQLLTTTGQVSKDQTCCLPVTQSIVMKH